jgi:hypothetical protein
VPNLKCECGGEEFVGVPGWVNIAKRSHLLPEVLPMTENRYMCAACGNIKHVPFIKTRIRVILNDKGEFVRTEEVKA